MSEEEKPTISSEKIDSSKVEFTVPLEPAYKPTTETMNTKPHTVALDTTYLANLLKKIEENTRPPTRLHKFLGDLYSGMIGGVLGFVIGIILGYVISRL